MPRDPGQGPSVTARLPKPRQECMPEPGHIQPSEGLPAPFQRVSKTARTLAVVDRRRRAAAVLPCVTNNVPLALLRSRGLGWTPAPELSRISLQYCRAIATLREQGHRIENRTEIRDGVRHGFYRLPASRVLLNLVEHPPRT